MTLMSWFVLVNQKHDQYSPIHGFNEPVLFSELKTYNSTSTVPFLNEWL